MNEDVQAVRIHRSLTKPVLWLEMERPYLLLVGMGLGIVAYVYITVIPVVVLVAVLAVAALWLGRVMGKIDPQMIAVVSESLNYRGVWLAAHSHPLAPPGRHKRKK